MCIPTFKCVYHMCIPTFSSCIVLRAQFPSPSFPCGSSPDTMKQLSLKPHLTAPSAKDDDSSSSSGSPAPAAKKRRISKGQPEHMRRTKRKRAFQESWKLGRPWLCWDPDKGMWCSTCHANRNNMGVAGPPSRRNALLNPTLIYSFRNVKAHGECRYHLLAVGLSQRLTTPVASLPVPLPSSILPQVQILFRTVLYMARTAGPYNQLRALLRLQVLNGVTYELRYGRKYVRVVLKFLAAVARKYLRKLWVTSTFRAIMTDEVKVADSQWLSTAARFYLGDQCITVPTGCGVLPAEDRDAKAIENALGGVFMKSSIHPWLDAAVVAITVDGASVLLSGLCDRLQQQAPHALVWYCVTTWVSTLTMEEPRGRLQVQE